MTFDQAHRVIKRGVIATLEQAIPDQIKPNAANEFGWTLLMLAALEGKTKIGALLIERGADVTLLNDLGESALSIAAHKGHLNFVQLLKAKGASGDVRPHGQALEDWLRSSSGLPPEKIDAIMKAV